MKNLLGVLIIQILLVTSISCGMGNRSSNTGTELTCPERESQFRWYTRDITFSMAHTDVVNEQEALDALKAAADTWNAEGFGPVISVQDKIWKRKEGLSPDSPNLVIFYTSNWIGDSKQTGLAYTYSNYGTRIFGADIAINAQDWQWSTVGEPLKADLQTVLLHELGHVLGLGHLDNIETTMYPSNLAGNIEGRTLHKDDQSAFACIYEDVDFI